MKKCENKFCGKKLKPKEGKLLNPKKRFCDKGCQTREYTLKNYHLKYKIDAEYKKYHKNYYKKWYNENKEKQAKNSQRNYKKNKTQCQERAYVNSKSNIKKIWKILGKFCINCGEKADEINHLKYNFPKKDQTLRGNKHDKYLKWYCLFLEPLCINCHRAKKKSKYLKLIK